MKIRSLQRYLLIRILSALTIGGLLLLVVSYFVTLDELGEVFDENLKQVALAAANHHDFEHLHEAPKLPRLHNFYGRKGSFNFVTAVWSIDGKLLFISDRKATLPFTRENGMKRFTHGEEEWHVYSIAIEKGTVQAAQRASSREALAAEVASKSILPTVLLVLTIGAMMFFALRRGLKPLDRAAQDVAKRSEMSLEPIHDEDLPSELRPLIRSLNALLARLREAFFLQRKFVADAAHGLRTPMTALRLQLQLLQNAGSDEVRQKSVEDLSQGIERSQHLIEQLLALSRLDPEATESNPEKIKLGDIVRNVVGHLAVKAEHKGIDLGAEVKAEAFIEGNTYQLMILFDNLVDNAIRYTPRGGVIDVRSAIVQGRPAIIVEDNGPGIPEAERARVFDRFYRGENAQVDAENATGSGLGLSIVKAIAERHHATLELGAGRDGKGLRVTVRF